MDASGPDRHWEGVPNELDEVEWSEVSESSDEKTTDKSTRAEWRRARKATSAAGQVTPWMWTRLP